MAPLLHRAAIKTMKPTTTISWRKLGVVLLALCSVASMPDCSSTITICFLPFIAAK